MLLPANKGRSQRVIRSKVDSPAGGKHRGLVYAEIELVSGDDLALYRRGFIAEEEIKSAKVEALVDSGAYSLVIGEHLREQLALPVLGERIARLADQTERVVKIAGPVELRFANRRTTTDALVFPGEIEVLLGSIPMEDLDVVIDPRQQRLIVNPDYPNIPLTYAK